MEKVDIGNFMGVLKATVQTEDGIMFPGDHMISGKPVVAEGVTMQQVMSDKEMAMTWHESIRGAYEREKEQRNHETRAANTPDLVIGGQDGNAGDGGGSPVPAQVDPAQAQEELQRPASIEEILEMEVDRAEAEIDYLGPRLEAAQDALQKASAALEALRAV